MRPLAVLVVTCVVLASCADVVTGQTTRLEALATASAAATPAPTVDPTRTPVPTPSPTPDPALRLPGGAAALPPLGTGVAFTGHILVSDVGNRRIVELDAKGEMTWSFPAQGDTAAAAYGPWDDAYYSWDGKTITANSAATSTVIAIDYATRKIKWQAGTLNKPAKGATGFSSPDDIAMALDGTSYVADILNCRFVHLGANGEYLGAVGSGRCVHDPPNSFASPNAAYPLADGGLLVTEITGSWIDRLAKDGSLLWTVHAPVTYPSDAVPYPDGSVLVADYVSPGQVVRLNKDGTVLWRFDYNKQLHNPSSVQPLASNRVAISDDFGNRILVVDPTTNEVVREFKDAGGVSFRVTDCVDYRPD